MRAKVAGYIGGLFFGLAFIAVFHLPLWVFPIMAIPSTVYIIHEWRESRVQS